MTLSNKAKCLLTLTMVWVGYGLSLAVDPYRIRPGLMPFYSPLNLGSGFLIYGIFWIMTGVFAAGGAIWPRRRGHWAYAALFPAPFLQVSIEIISFTNWIIDPRSGFEFGWVSAIPWLGFMLLVIFIAGWSENPQTHDGQGVQR